MSDTQRIKDGIDVVDFINEYVKLKPAGNRHKGLCPFHNEKSPSFMVSRDRQSWHCFGCNEGGDIFTFVQKIEGMEFIEALKMLADRAGVVLENKFNSAQNKNERERLRAIMKDAAHFFHQFFLQMEAAEPARKYVKETRNLSDDTIANWQIGFVSDQWDLLTTYLLKKGHGIEDLVTAGLTIKRDGANFDTGKGYYDRFRGRVMFPIWDVHGYVVGFTGRVLVETDKSGGKYVNTPQTPLYDKSRIVFGLDKAKHSIKKENLVVIVEGQMDVVAAHQAGYTNVVASSGTALTVEQIKLLCRYSKNMAMAFDADQAGIAAAERGIEIAISEGMNVKVIQIPEGKGKDPDECINKNPSVWEACVSRAQGVMDWYISSALKGIDLSNPRDKQSVVDKVLPKVVKIPFAVEKDHWMNQLAGAIGVDVAVLREDAKRVNAGANTTSFSASEKGVSGNFRGDSPVKKQLIQSPEEKRLIALVERFLALIITQNERIIDNWSTNVDNFPLYSAIKSRYNDIGPFKGKEFFVESSFSEYRDDLNRLMFVADEEFANLSLKQAKMEAESIHFELSNLVKKQLQANLIKQIEVAEASGDKEVLDSLLKEFQALYS